MKNNLHKRSSRDNMDRKLFSLVVTFSLRQLRKYLRYKVRILDLSKNLPGKCSGNLNHTEHTLQPKGRSGAPHPGCARLPAGLGFLRGRRRRKVPGDLFCSEQTAKWTYLQQGRFIHFVGWWKEIRLQSLLFALLSSLYFFPLLFLALSGQSSCNYPLQLSTSMQITSTSNSVFSPEPQIHTINGCLQPSVSHTYLKRQRQMTQHASPAPHTHTHTHTHTQHTYPFFCVTYIRWEDYAAFQAKQLKLSKLILSL